MAHQKYRSAPTEQIGMPSGIKYIVGNEAAERFSFYGMNAILYVFMTEYLLNASGEHAPMGANEATAWMHRFKAGVYLFPILGAIIADVLLGKYMTIITLSMIYCAGHAVLACLDFNLGIDPRLILGTGLFLIAVGSGGIKPCVSAHVGDQFGESNKHLIPKVFQWFYFSINLGAAAAYLIIPKLLKSDNFGPAWAFGVPGVVMAIATLLFWMGRNSYIHIPAKGKGFFQESFSKDGLRAMKGLIALYIFISMFWALFDQTSSSWVEQAKSMDRVLFHMGDRPFEFDPSETQAFNPMLVMILIPLFSLVIYPAVNRVINFTPLRKIGLGLFLAIPAFAIPAWIQMRIDGGETPTIYWQLAAYIFLTAAEILVSITTLEFSYTQAPPKMKSFVMGLYFLSITAGNLFVAEVNHMISKNQASGGDSFLEGASYFWFFTGCMAIMAVGFVIWSQFYKGQTYIQQSEPVS